MKIKRLESYDDIAQSFNVFVELRPHLTSEQSFINQIIEQQKEGYQIIAIEKESEFVSCIGFRFLITLACGKVLYIDDFITKEKARGKGYGKILLEHVIKIAKEQLCQAIHLDTGYNRHAAHKVYLKQGFEFYCHHLALKFK